MTLQGLETQLNDITEVLETEQKNTGTHFSYNVHQFSYLYQVSDGRLRDGQFDVLEKNGEVFFWKAIPAILTQPVQVRDFHYSEQTIINAIESTFSVKVTKIHINRRGDQDEVTLIVNDSAKNLLEEWVFMVWKEGQETKHKRIK